MNLRDLTSLLGLCGLLFVLWAIFAANRREAAAKQRRLDALLGALGDPAVDPATRAELLRTLAREHRGFRGWLWDKVGNPVLWRMLWFSAGWILMVFAATMLALHVAGIARLSSDGLPSAFLALAGGFAIVTLPMARREVARRERAAAEHR
jgi:hypothetical protein